MYASSTATLEAAQEVKYERILAALDLSPDHSLLEIGCGWGQLAETAAARVASVTGITISQQQLEAALPGHRYEAMRSLPVGAPGLLSGHTVSGAGPRARGTVRAR